MQTDQALNILEALIVLTGDPKLSLAQCCGILRNIKSAIEIQPTSDAKSPVKSPVKSRFVSVGKKPGPKPGKKKLGRPRKVAQK